MVYAGKLISNSPHQMPLLYCSGWAGIKFSALIPALIEGKEPAGDDRGAWSMVLNRHMMRSALGYYDARGIWE